MRVRKTLLFAAAVVVGQSVTASAQASKLDRLAVYEAEARRCIRYYLSDERKGRALTLLGIHPEDLCRCSTPLFVSGLTDQEVMGIYRSQDGFTPAIINRFLLSGQACVAQLSH